LALGIVVNRRVSQKFLEKRKKLQLISCTEYGK
jgi:hypothetical protein